MEELERGEDRLLPPMCGCDARQCLIFQVLGHAVHASQEVADVVFDANSGCCSSSGRSHKPSRAAPGASADMSITHFVITHFGVTHLRVTHRLRLEPPLTASDPDLS